MKTFKNRRKAFEPSSVFITEIIVLQNWKVHDIVGFTVRGGKNVRMRYADDAIIIIKQYKCFAEVYTDLSNFERVSGAKVNYEETKDLWGDAWKDRTDIPLNMKGTNKNFENLF